MTNLAQNNARRPPLQLAGYLARRAIRMEICVWQSLYRFICRRPRVPPRAVGFSYHQQVFQVLITFIVLAAIEIPLFDLIVHRWVYVRIPLLVAGIWGLTWMVGLLLGFLTRPHAVGPEGIRVRNGAEVDIPLSWPDVYSVSRKTTGPERQPRITHEPDGTTVRFPIQHETNIEIELERQLDVRLPQGREQVRRLQIYVDDHKGFLKAVREHLV